MKSFAQFAGFSLALAIAGLGSGCASSTPTATYHRPAQDFEVVESSTDRPLTDSEKAEVRTSVASYLDREGITDGGDYFLKVYLTPENVDADSEWVVVRFTRYTDQRVAVVSAYPYDNYMYSSYYPYYAYDIYPYGYGCVARISFQYYVDPFYHQRYYYYPYHGHGGHKGDYHDTAHNHGGKPHDANNHNNPREHSGPPPVPPGSRYTGNHSGRPIDPDAPIRPNRNQWRGRPGTPASPADVANNDGQPQAPARTNNQYPRTHDYRPAGSATGSTPLSADNNTPQGNNRNTPNASVTGQTPDVATGAGQQRDNSRNQWRARPGTGGTPPGVANNRNRPDAPNRVNNSNPGSPDQRPAPSRVNNPARAEAYVAPSANRPASNYSRPAPSAQQNRSPAPSYQQPARSAPSSSNNNSNDSQREAMR